MILAVVAASVLAPFVVMAIYVEDWSRDLTTNVAWTDPEEEDNSLRPVEFVGGWKELTNLLEGFDESCPNWSQPQPPALLPKTSPVYAMTAQPEGETQFHFVRTSGLMRYRDDVWVVAEPLRKQADDRIVWRLHAHSQSRIGKGDLGQNPRNLRELLNALRTLSTAASR